jgi:hypothetical protein
LVYEFATYLHQLKATLDVFLLIFLCFGVFYDIPAFSNIGLPLTCLLAVVGLYFAPEMGRR